MMCLCRYGRYTGQLERERPGYITVRDLGRSGCPSCIGQIWGSQVCGEPVDESRGIITGPDYQLLGSRSGDLCSAGAQDRTDGPGCVLPDRPPTIGDSGRHAASVAAGAAYHGFCGMPLSTGSSSQGDLNIDRGSREARNPCSGRSCAANPGQPGVPSHHWGADDVSGKCIGWDLLWVGPNAVGVAKATVVTMQEAGEPWLCIWDFAVRLLL